MLLLVAILAAAGGAAPGGWQRVYAADDENAGLASVAVSERGEWVAAGGETIVQEIAGQVHRTTESGRFIEGLATGAKASLVAVGRDDLILRWDGRSWIEESFSSKAEHLGRIARRAYVLTGALYFPGEPEVAYGPWRVLVQQPDGKWVAPEEKERYRLMMRAQLGPDESRIDGCARQQWRWLPGGDGWLSCADGRTFIAQARGGPVARGRLPKPCRALGALVRRGETLFATCDRGEVWRADGPRWSRVPAPRIDAIAAGGGCLYGVDRNTVWRNCVLP